MSVAIAIGLSDQAKRLIAEWQTAPTRIVEALDQGMTQVVTEIESSIKVTELSGRAGAGAGGRTPVGLRSGALRQAVTGAKDGRLSGFVGTTRGSTTPYARTILGPGSTTIRPTKAKHLWVPIAANLGPSGQARYTPRGLFDTFGDRVKIFKSKAGNTVVFVEDPRNNDGSRARFKRDSKKSGRSKGDLKGKLYFVLKDEVVVHGTDALAQGVQRMGPRSAEILTQHLQRAFPGSGAPGSGGAA